MPGRDKTGGAALLECRPGLFDLLLLRQFLLLQLAKRNTGFGFPLLFAVGGCAHEELSGG